MASKFLIVGAAGFVVDYLIFLLFFTISGNLLMSRVISFWGAANFIWLGHRYFTFQAREQSAFKQWLQHMLGCHMTGLLNIGVFIMTIQWLPVQLSFILGVLVGTVTNYLWSSKVVFAGKKV